MTWTPGSGRCAHIGATLGLDLGACSDAEVLAGWDDRGVRTLVIVDDHTGFRASARALLELDDFDVVGEAGDGAGALTAVGRLAPEVVLLDIGLPDMSGFDVAELISSRTAVVLVSSRSPDQVSKRARGCGAVGFIAKDELTGAALEALVAAAP
jgi:two-component system response regulator EvgA